jgi:TPR repeat protein
LSALLKPRLWLLPLVVAGLTGCADWRQNLDSADAQIRDFFHRNLSLDQSTPAKPDTVADAARAMNGDGVPRNPARGVALLRPAAEAGDRDAQFMLALAYRSGQGVAASDAEAARWLDRAARQGHVQAQYLLGLAYLRGRGVAADPKTAVSWFAQAADKGDAAAQYHLGLAYASGEGVARNETGGLGWLERSADQGYAEAQYAVGDMYQTGQGARRNIPWATRWYAKAAAQGLAEAQYRMGLAYAAGAGAPQNFETSYMWFDLAARNGSPEAPKFRDALAPKLDAGALARGKARAAAWRPVAAEETAKRTDAPTVIFVQQTLDSLGYDAGPADGVVGARTKRALADYQRKQGISEEGQIGPQSLSRLKDDVPAARS